MTNNEVPISSEPVRAGSFTGRFNRYRVLVTEQLQCGDLAVSPLVRETSRNVWELSNLTWVEGQPWEREKMVILQGSDQSEGEAGSREECQAHAWAVGIGAVKRQDLFL